MFPYLFVFILNILLAYNADKMYYKSKKSKWLSLILLVILNTLFCGLRDFGIGRDTNVYVDSYFDYAMTMNSTKDFIAFEEDKGFLILAYITSLFTNNSHYLMLSTELIIILFFVLFLNKLKKLYDVDMWAYTFIFCFLYYCHSINLMRQFCAMSILLYAYMLLVENKWMTYLFLHVIAYFFHSSAIVFIFVPLIYYLNYIKSDKRKYILTFMIVLILFLSYYCYYRFLIYFSNSGIIKEIYAERYGKTGDFVNNGTGYGIRYYLSYLLLPIFSIYLSYKNNLFNKKDIYISISLLLIYLCFDRLGVIMSYMNRLAFYIAIVYYIYIAKILASPKIVLIIKILFICIYINYWYHLFIELNGGNVYPYSSKILGL